MHFLCLHGAGTNNKIFKAQTAALRYELGDQHTYEFVEGTVSSAMAPEIKSFSNSAEICYSYFDPESPQSVLEALTYLKEYLLTEGPFDGVLAFSQGATLAAMHAFREAHIGQRNSKTESSTLPIKCLILLSASLVHDPLAFEERGEIKVLSSFSNDEPIRIPTVHIWGAADDTRSESVEFSKLCDRDLRTVFVHSGAHDTPPKNDITEAVKAMRRGISKALQK